MIRCGWCGKPTANRDRCSTCGHEDPARPWVQRAEEPPVIRTDAVGRPALDPKAVRARLDDARRALGPGATTAALAEFLDVSEKTVRRWSKVSG